MINKLVSKIQKTHAPIVVGLDPMMNYIPEHIQKKAFAEFGETLEGAAEAVWQYNKEIVDAVWDLIPAVKPQIAMYEQFGIPGMMAFKKTVDYCHEKDLVVIGDIKRGDIGSTSEAYAVGHLGKVQVGANSFYGFDEDFATVNPYLGSDGVKPFITVPPPMQEIRDHPCRSSYCVRGNARPPLWTGTHRPGRLRSRRPSFLPWRSSRQCSSPLHKP